MPLTLPSNQFVSKMSGLNRSRETNTRGKPTNVAPRQGLGSARRDSNLLDRDKDKDKDRGKDTRRPSGRQNSAISPSTPGPGRPPSPRLLEGSTDNGKTTPHHLHLTLLVTFEQYAHCSKLVRLSFPRPPTPKASQSQTPAFAKHPELKPILDSISLRSWHYIDLHEALDIQNKAEVCLNKPVQAEFFSEVSILKLRIEQAKDRSTKATKSLEDADRKLIATIAPFWENQSKQTQSTEIVKVEIASLQKTLESAIDQKFDNRDQKMETTVTKSQNEQTQRFERWENALSQQQAKIAEQEALLNERQNNMINEMNAMKASLTTQQEIHQRQLADIEKRFQNEAQARNDTVATVVQQLMTTTYSPQATQQIEAVDRRLCGRLEAEQAGLLKQLQAAKAEFLQQIDNEKAQLRQQHQAEKADLRQQLKDQNARYDELSQSLGDLRVRVNETDFVTSDTMNLRFQLKGESDSVKFKELRDQAVTHQQHIEDQQFERSRHQDRLEDRLEALSREIRDARPRFIETPPAISSLSSEQLETRLLVHYKDLFKDLQKQDIRLENLEQASTNKSIMTDVEIQAIATKQVKEEIEMYRTKLEKLVVYAETFLNREINARDMEMKPTIEKLQQEVATFKEALVQKADKDSKSTETQATLDTLIKQMAALIDPGGTIDQLLSDFEDLANRIAHVTEFQNNFNSTSMVRDMAAHISNAVPRGFQTQLNDLVALCNNLQQEVRRLVDSGQNKRRKVSIHGT